MKGTGPTSGAALHKACRNGQTGIVESQLDQDTDIHSRDARDSTPLHSAAYAGQEEVVQILLERGANLGSLDKDKRTPLHRAIQEAHESVVRVLLAAGPIGLEFQDVYGLTPLHLAVRVATWEGEKMLNIIKALLSAGASLDTTTFSGMCPTYEAIEFGAEAVANMLCAERDPHHEPLHTPGGYVSQA
jgi:ankyrin repeat protein